MKEENGDVRARPARDWASFWFTGSNVLPLFMVLANEAALDGAILVYMLLLGAAIWSATRAERNPAAPPSGGCR